MVDRLIVRGGIERRLTESIDMALNLADDIVVINSYDGGDRLFSRRLACVDCGLSMPEMTPRAFSFNSPHGACPDCQGLGATIDFDPQRVVPDESKSLADGAIAAVGARRSQAGPRGAAGAGARISASICTVPFAQAAAQGAAKCCSSAAGTRSAFEGLIPNLRRRFEEGSWAVQEELEPYRSLRPVPDLPRRAPEAAEPVGQGQRRGRSPTT